MKTEMIKVAAENFDKSLGKAAELIRAGKVVGMPTETVYGLAADACSDSAVKAIFVAKGRPQDNPLIVHICDYVMMTEIVERVTDAAKELGRAFWPGPLTIVLPKSPLICGTVTCGLDTVAVRMPSHPVAAELIRRSGVPLAAPSANISGKPSTTTAQHVLDDMDGKISLILDGGACEIGIESTVVSLTGDKPLILRPGIISLGDVRRVLPNAEMSPHAMHMLADGERAESPGMKHTHYSPNAQVTIVDGTLAQFNEYTKSKRCNGAFAMCFDGEQDEIDMPSVSYGEKADVHSQARRLFATLRALDKMDASYVYARAPSSDDAAAGVLNRLIRAAGFTLIKL